MVMGDALFKFAVLLIVLIVAMERVDLALLATSSKI
jgi:hypothetical protein